MVKWNLAQQCQIFLTSEDQLTGRAVLTELRTKATVASTDKLLGKDQTGGKRAKMLEQAKKTQGTLFYLGVKTGETMKFSLHGEP